MSDKLDVYHQTLTDWDEFRKWCEDRRGAALVAKDLSLFVQLFRETQDRLRCKQLLQGITGQDAGHKDGAHPLEMRDGMEKKAGFG